MRSSGIGLFGIITVVLVTLKLTENIDWSWWAVTALIWVPWALFASIVLIGLLLKVSK